MYGAPLGKSGKAADQMNENPELGSSWKGRILMQIYAVKTDKPVFKIEQIPEEAVEKAQRYMKVRKFRFMT